MAEAPAVDPREELHALAEAALTQLQILQGSGCDALGQKLPPSAASAARAAARSVPQRPTQAAAVATQPARSVAVRPSASPGVSPVEPSPAEPAPVVLAARIAGPRGIATPEIANRLTVLAQEVRGCTRCGLHQGRTQTVFSRGTGSSGLCFIGEGPGADEDIQGLPFVGKAGQLLDKMIVAMGLQPDEVYVCNIVKCRPPDNRKPAPEEMAACIPYLKEQIDLIAPEVIVALGATAVQGLFGTTEGITRLRGRWKLHGKIPVMPTFHPAYLLREPSAKRDVWTDLQAVLKHMGRPLPNTKG